MSKWRQPDGQNSIILQWGLDPDEHPTRTIAGQLWFYNKNYIVQVTGTHCFCDVKNPNLKKIYAARTILCKKRVHIAYVMLRTLSWRRIMNNSEHYVYVVRLRRKAIFKITSRRPRAFTLTTNRNISTGKVTYLIYAHRLALL